MRWAVHSRITLLGHFSLSLSLSLSHFQDEDVAQEKNRVNGITRAGESQVVVIKNLFKVLSIVVILVEMGEVVQGATSYKASALVLYIVEYY